jgi:hypothetical protein
LCEIAGMAAPRLRGASFPTVQSSRDAYKTTLQARALDTASVLQKQLHGASGGDAALSLREAPLEAAVFHAGALQLPPMHDVLAELCPRTAPPREPRAGADAARLSKESSPPKGRESKSGGDWVNRRASCMTTSTAVGSNDSDSDSDSDF